MLYTTTKCCRICKSTNLESIFNLGDQALTGVFPKSTSENVPIGPVELVKCSETKGGCGSKATSRPRSNFTESKCTESDCTETVRRIGTSE